MTMMRRVDLLPARYAARRRERRNVGVVAVIGLAVVGLLIAWWFLLTTQVSDAENDLAAVQSQNAALQAQIDELEPFARLEADIQARRTALVSVMEGDINWPSLMTEIAMVIPGEVWLETLNASAGATEGSTQVGTETATIRISNKDPVGRISFTGRALTMPGVAKWLIAQARAKAFMAVWLNSATVEGGETDGGTSTVSFDSTLELDEDGLSERFQRGLP